MFETSRDSNRFDLFASVLALALILLPGAALGQEGGDDSVWEPAVFADESISLTEALGLTLASNPRIRLDEESARFREGVLQEASGQFDGTFNAELSYDRSRDNLRASVLRRENETRDELNESIETTRTQLGAAESTLDEIVALQADPTGSMVSDPDLQTTLRVINLSIENADSDEERAELVATRDQIIDEARATYETLVGDLGDILEMDSLDLANLGAAPDEEETVFGRANLQYLMPQRNGIVWGPFLEFTLDSNIFRGKANDSDFGGKGIEDVYRSTVGFTIDLPLARGRGTAASGAFERAARIDWEASLLTLTHSASVSLFDTLRSYWATVALAENVVVFEESARLQAKLVEYTRALIEADETPASELARARAREAQALAALEDVKRAEYEARILLAEVIGLKVEDESQAPAAADAFPTPADAREVGAVPLDRVLPQALRSRFDYRAATRLVESGGVLAEAARINLRPRVDLGSRFFYNSSAEKSGSDALSGGYVGPSYNLAFDIEWPFANNTQKGVYLQADALSRTSAISAADLSRLIGSGIVESLGSMDETLEQLRYAEEAVGHYRESLDAEVERYRFGSATLIDTLLTEQRLTEARLSLVAARQRYASLLARLRFETGTLVSEREDGGLVVRDDLEGLPSFTEGE